MSVSCVVACLGRWRRNVVSHGRRREPKSLSRKGDGLNWTVFNAATSQPSDCIAKTAILLPTWLDAQRASSQHGIKKGTKAGEDVSSSGWELTLTQPDKQLLVPGTVETSIAAYWQTERPSYMAGNGQDPRFGHWRLGRHGVRFGRKKGSENKKGECGGAASVGRTTASVKGGECRSGKRQAHDGRPQKKSHRAW